MQKAMKTAICYSWDDDGHKLWVRDFAARLRADRIDVQLDQWNLQLGGRLPAFMERLIRDSEVVVIICTPGYKDRFDGRKGGTGYEGHIICADILSSGSEKFIPVLRAGDWNTSIPTVLEGVMGVDLRGDPYSEDNYQQLVRWLNGVTDPPPALREQPEWLQADRGRSSARLPAPTEWIKQQREKALRESWKTNDERL
jgi:hypothetical protein